MAIREIPYKKEKFTISYEIIAPKIKATGGADMGETSGTNSNLGQNFAPNATQNTTNETARNAVGKIAPTAPNEPAQPIANPAQPAANKPTQPPKSRGWGVSDNDDTAASGAINNVTAAGNKSDGGTEANSNLTTAQNETSVAINSNLTTAPNKTNATSNPTQIAAQATQPTTKTTPTTPAAQPLAQNTAQPVARASIGGGDMAFALESDLKLNHAHKKTARKKGTNAEQTRANFGGYTLNGRDFDINFVPQNVAQNPTRNAPQQTPNSNLNDISPAQNTTENKQNATETTAPTATNSANLNLTPANDNPQIAEPNPAPQPAAKTPTIVVLHGWGANKTLMRMAFKSGFESARQIYIDLSGFGKSSAPVPLTTQNYAEILQIFLNEIGVNADCIVGHSFGGKVATLLNPPLLVLLSSAGIIIKKPFGVRLKIALFKTLKIFGLGKFYKNFASKDAAGLNKIMYQTFKNVVNEDFSGKFKNFANPVLIFWGKADTATPLSSGEKIHKLIKNSTFYPLEGDHFFFLNNTRFITEKIIAALTCENVCETA